MTRFRPVVALRLFLTIMTCSRQIREATSFFLMPHSSSLRTIKSPLHHPQQQRQHQRVPFSSSLAAAPIVDQVTDEMKVAMKAKDATTLSTVRLIRSAFSNACIELQVPQLNDEQAVTVLRKLAKMRQESIQMFQDGGAFDRAEAERAELKVIERWLPQLANEEQTTKWVQEAIAKVGSVDNVGKIMGALMQQHKNELDGTLAQRIVKEEVAKAKQQ